METGVHLDPAVKEVQYNPTYETMFAPEVRKCIIVKSVFCYIVFKLYIRDKQLVNFSVFSHESILFKLLENISCYMLVISQF